MPRAATALIAVGVLLALTPAASAEVRTGAGNDDVPGDGPTSSLDVQSFTASYDTGGGVSGSVTLGAPPSGDSLVTIAFGTLSGGSCGFPGGGLGGLVDPSSALSALTFNGQGYPGSKSTSGSTISMAATNAVVAGQGFNCAIAATSENGGAETIYDRTPYAPLAAPPAPPPARVPSPAPARPVARPKLRVRVSRVPKRLRRNRAARARITVTNTGTATARNVKLAVGTARGFGSKLSRSSVRSLRAGKSVTITARLKISRRAKRTTSVKVVASGAGVAKARVALTLKAYVKPKRRQR